MVQIIPNENANPWGKVGKGFGKALSEGLAESIPKEAMRYRLAEGLKSLEKDSANLTPFQQFTKFASTPGVAENPQLIESGSRLLRQERQRDGGKDSLVQPGKPQSSAQPIVSEKNKEKPYAEQEKNAQKKKSLKPLSATKAETTPFLSKDANQLFEEARALSKSDPYNFPTPQDALPIIQANESTRKSNYDYEILAGSRADVQKNRIVGDLQKHWGKELIDKDIQGTIQTKLFNNLEDELASEDNKLTESQLTRKYGDIGKNLGMQMTNLDTRSKESLLSGNYSPKKIRDSIFNIQKDFEKANANEELKDILSSKFDLSPLGAASQAFPETKAVKSYLKGLKPPKVNTYGVPDQHEILVKSIKAADEINNYVSEKDSLHSVAQSLKNYDLDPKIFFDRLIENRKLGIFKPSDLQAKELAQGIPTFPSLGDLYILE